MLHHLCPAFNPLTSQVLSNPSQSSSRRSLSLEVWNESEWVEWALSLAAINISPSIVHFKLLLYSVAICTICSSWRSDYSTSSLENVWSPRCPWHLWTVVLQMFILLVLSIEEALWGMPEPLFSDVFLPDPGVQQFRLTNQGQILPANPSLTGLMTLDSHYVNLKKHYNTSFPDRKSSENRICLSLSF